MKRKTASVQQLFFVATRRGQKLGRSDFCITITHPASGQEEHNGPLRNTTMYVRTYMDYVYYYYSENKDDDGDEIFFVLPSPPPKMFVPQTQNIMHAREQ